MTGLIVLWSGAIVDIPNGWALCDGDNGTPDLRNQFVVGAGDTYNPGASGGSLQHGHPMNTTSEKVQITGDTGDTEACLKSGSDIDAAYYDPYFDQCSEVHYHSVGLEGEGHSHENTTDDANHLPPYFALAYIMKVS